MHELGRCLDVVGTRTWLVRRRGLSNEDGVYKDVVWKDEKGGGADKGGGKVFRLNTI